MKLISRENLKEKLDRGDDFRLVMVLGEWAYRAKRIPDSLHFDTIEVGLEAGVISGARDDTLGEGAPRG